MSTTKQHHYHLSLEWTGNQGKGTSSYRSYSRDYYIKIGNKPPIHGSSDPSFLGDPNKYNPEELFLAAISSCHMLWYLHLCANAGIQVMSYLDSPEGSMEEKENGSGAFAAIILKPRVQIIQAEHQRLALQLHEKASEYCFIANSVNFPIYHQGKVTILNL